MNVLFISDTHAPYHHRDTISFLKALADKVQPHIVISVGDLVDNHYPNYHDKEPDAYSGSDEIRHSRKFLKQLQEEFPYMVITEGNHCKMTYRKAKTANIPPEWIKNYNDLYELQDTWDWFDRFEFSTGRGLPDCLVTHNISSSTRNNARNYSHCSVQGHHHGVFEICYSADINVLRWSMTVGCLVDNKAPVFRYGHGSIKNKPIIGTGALIGGNPVLFPMRLNTKGRWNKKV